MTNGDGSLAITNFGAVSLSDPHQMQRWGVIWNAPNDQTKFWITNPYNPVYNGSYPNGYIGTTISEETVQLEDTLVAIYNIPTNATKPDWNHNGVAMANYQLLEGQIPTNYTAVIDNASTSGRLFLHYTNVLISLFITTNFTWVADTNLTNYFQIPANILGLVVETASPGDYPQSTAAARLAAFQSDVLAASSVNTNFLKGANPEMIYTNRHGCALQITFGQGAKTNGQSVDYQQWPAISNPWMYQPQLGNLFIFGTNRTIIYNFNTWSETTNNQPVLLSNAPPATPNNAHVNIDLHSYVSDAETAPGNLLFTVSNPAHGTVSLLADGHTAQFMPAAGYAGPASFTFSATDEGIYPQLVLQYDFQPPGSLSSNVIADVSGNARSASVVTVGGGAVAYTASVPPALALYHSQSLLLTQTNGVAAESLSRMVTPGNLSMTNGSWTFATWFQRATTTNDNFIFYVGDSKGFGGDGDELQLYCPGNTNSVELRHWNASNVLDVDIASPLVVQNNQWHHVALSYLRAADNTGNVTLYLDGAAVGAANNVSWQLHQDYPLVFGGHNSTTKVYRWFNGSLDDLALFRGALSPSQIAQLAASTVSHFGGWTVTNSVALTVTAATNSAPALGAVSVAGNQFVLQVTGGFGTNYWIQASSDLQTWTNVFGTNSPALPYEWADPNFPTFSHRFYRLLLPP